MIRLYFCPDCRKKTYHYYRKAERSGGESNQVCLYFQCPECGHLHTVMRYVTEQGVTPPPRNENVSLPKEIFE